MNILHVTPYYAPAWSYGGVVSAVTGLATAQAARGHHVRVLTTDALDSEARNLTNREIIDQVEVIRCRNLSNWLHARFNLSLPVGFRAAFGQLAAETDIVHCHELRIAENLLIDPRKPIVLSPHGTLSYTTGRGALKRAWDRLFGRVVLRRMDHVAALTTAEESEAHTLWHSLGVPFPGASLVPNGVPADFSPTGDLRPRYGLGEGPVVLFLGRLHARKGLQILIPAFARAVRDFPTARLLIAGPDAGMLPAARSLVAQLGIDHQVIFTGLLSGGDQWAALASADLFVLPAIGEGLPMAALEAMAAGLPIVVTPGCNLPDVETRGAGLLVERAIEPLAAALRALLADPDRRRRMGEQGRAWVRESFTWPAIAAKTEEIYSQVLKMDAFEIKIQE
jgi:glycosyltransferase involved in cell wall biosynthesis